MYLYLNQQSTMRIKDKVKNRSIKATKQSNQLVEPFGGDGDGYR